MESSIAKTNISGWLYFISGWKDPNGWAGDDGRSGII